jgi:SAM-dependent methyltransferase
VSCNLPASLRPPNHYTAGDTSLAQHLEERLRRAAGGCSAKRLLDVGAGNGIFLQHAREAGWDVLGLEADEGAAGRIRRSGLACREGTIESLPADTTPFGLVHMNHVLEHMDDPFSACVAARSLLRSRGVRVIEVPNELASVTARLRRAFGRRSSSATSFLQHQWFFDVRSIRELLVAAGFARVAARTVSRLRPVRIPRLPLAALGPALGMGDVIEAWAWTADSN